MGGGSGWNINPIRVGTEKSVLSWNAKQKGEDGMPAPFNNLLKEKKSGPWFIFCESIEGLAF